MPNLPLLLTPEQLARHLDDPDLLVIDLSSAENYAKGHLPGAIHLDPKLLLRGEGPVANRLPTAEQLSARFSAIGLNGNSQVVAYDDQMGPWAGRLIWTLDILGHRQASVLDGQLPAWIGQGLPLESVTNTPTPSRFKAQLDLSLLADKDYLLSQLGRPSLRIWDARSEAEYRGDKLINVRKGGHIPGARHLEWTDTLISSDDWRIKPEDALRDLLNQAGITPDREVVMHCQTHRRSGLTYLVAKSLGYPKLRCYDGSWFEWGNDPDTPVETSN